MSSMSRSGSRSASSPTTGSELPSYRANLVRPDALASALGLTEQPYYRGVFEKAGALLRSMVKNHPYVDGNKRLGLATTFLFLALNGRILVASNDELVEFAKELAGTQMKWRTVARWLRSHSVTPEDLAADGALSTETESLVTDRVPALVEEVANHSEALLQDIRKREAGI